MSKQLSWNRIIACLLLTAGLASAQFPTHGQLDINLFGWAGEQVTDAWGRTVMELTPASSGSPLAEVGLIYPATFGVPYGVLYWERPQSGPGHLGVLQPTSSPYLPTPFPMLPSLELDPADTYATLVDLGLSPGQVPTAFFTDVIDPSFHIADQRWQTWTVDASAPVGVFVTPLSAHRWSEWTLQPFEARWSEVVPLNGSHDPTTIPSVVQAEASASSLPQLYGFSYVEFPGGDRWLVSPGAAGFRFGPFTASTAEITHTFGTFGGCCEHVYSRIVIPGEATFAVDADPMTGAIFLGTLIPLQVFENGTLTGTLSAGFRFNPTVNTQTHPLAPSPHGWQQGGPWAQ